MKAVTVFPGKVRNGQLAELAKPKINDVPDVRGVLVKVLRVGVDGTDKEINDAEYGVAPPGYEFLVLGHESFGQVVEVGSKVTRFKQGDYVVATVRRPGCSSRASVSTGSASSPCRAAWARRCPRSAAR